MKLRIFQITTIKIQTIIRKIIIIIVIILILVNYS